MQIHIPPLSGENYIAANAPKPVYISQLKLSGRDFLHQRSPHCHPNLIEWLYVLSGSAEYEIMDTRYPVTAGDLLIYNSNVVHYEYLERKNHSILCLGATDIQLPGLEPNCILPSGASPVLHLDEHRRIIQSLMQSIWDSATSGLPHSSLTCHSLFLSLMSITLDIIEHATVSELIEQPNLGHKIRKFVDTQPVESINAPQVANEFGISETYCARVFRQSFGISLVSYIVQRKIGEAQTLLLTTDLSIKEIGDLVGYHNQSYFSRVFMQIAGVTPLRYRKMFVLPITKKEDAE